MANRASLRPLLLLLLLLLLLQLWPGRADLRQFSSCQSLVSCGRRASATVAVQLRGGKLWSLKR